MGFASGLGDEVIPSQPDRYRSGSDMTAIVLGLLPTRTARDTKASKVEWMGIMTVLHWVLSLSVTGRSRSPTPVEILETHAILCSRRHTRGDRLTTTDCALLSIRP